MQRKILLEVGEVGLDEIEIILSQSHRFDLVLMDIQMPEMDGDEALLILRKMEEERERHLPVIALTANAINGDKEKFLRMGFDGYLGKPVMAKEMVDEMMRVVGLRRASEDFRD